LLSYDYFFTGKVFTKPSLLILMAGFIESLTVAVNCTDVLSRCYRFSSHIYRQIFRYSIQHGKKPSRQILLSFTLESMSLNGTVSFRRQCLILLLFVSYFSIFNYPVMSSVVSVMTDKGSVLPFSRSPYLPPYSLIFLLIKYQTLYTNFSGKI
jgi:hypothetical protein